MSADRFTEVSRESWLGRIGGAIKGVFVGIVLALVAVVLLFWNEGRAVKTYKTLKEGGGAVVSVPSEKVDPAKEGKLIHVTGMADTAATITDSVFGVSAHALKLRRAVEMYQWTETVRSESRKKMGGGTETVKTYSYGKSWSERQIQSANFKQPAGHENPKSFPYPSSELVAEKVTVGAYVLSASLLGMIRSFESLPVGGGAALPEQTAGKVKARDGGFYIGTDPASPQVGDARIRFEVVKPAEVSVIAMQAGTTFAPYATKSGGTIELLQMGTYPASAMIQKAQESNKLLTWVFRLVGFVLMLLGLNMFLKPLSVIADVVPILGNIVGAGTGLVAFMLAAVLSTTTMAIAWIVYRPLVAIILIAVAVGVTVAIRSRLKSARVAA